MSNNQTIIFQDIEYVKDDSPDFQKGDFVATEEYQGEELIGHTVKKIAFRKEHKDPFREKRIAEVFFEGEIGNAKAVGFGTGWFKVKKK